MKRKRFTEEQIVGTLKKPRPGRDCLARLRTIAIPAHVSPP